MSRRFIKRAAAVAVLVALLAACGNSGDDAATTTSGGSSDTSTSGGTGNRTTHNAITGVPGVTDDAITYSVVGSKTGNPLGTCILDCYAAGIRAYFAFRNDEGGIFGRDLVLDDPIDDQVTSNQQKALDVISANKSFGNFQATLLASGWADLEKAGIPTYAWGINAAEAANSPHIFPSTVIRCADCTGRAVPYLAQQAGAKHGASLGYGITENSKVCAQNNGASFELYEKETGVDSAYVNDHLAYGLTNGIGPEVTAMKKAGVDVIATCIDLNGMKTLAQELHRQDMDDVVLLHPNTYDQKFVADAGDLFEGDYVSVQFRPFEADNEGTAFEDFQTWMGKQNAEITELAMAGWINASLAFDGLLAAGPDFDQQKVTDATNKMTAYTAGGLLEPVDWTQAHTPYTNATRQVDDGKECFAAVQVTDGKFEVVGDAAKPWLCWPKVSDTAWSEPESTNFG